jgi:hypothetical protein
MASVTVHVPFVVEFDADDQPTAVAVGYPHPFAPEGIADTDRDRVLAIQAAAVGAASATVEAARRLAGEGDDEDAGAVPPDETAVPAVETDPLEVVDPIAVDDPDPGRPGDAPGKRPR